MSKLYYIKFEVIDQAERMKDKYYFLSEQEEWKVIYQGQENYPKLSSKEVDNCWKMAERYRAEGDKINEALINIKGRNQAEWKYLEILREASYERDLLDSIL